MRRILGLVGGLLVAVMAVGCASTTDGEDAQDQEGAASTSSLRAVDITVSARKTGENYEGRAYPVDDVDEDGRTELYNAPVYYVYIDGTDASGKRVRKEYKAPRYMPYNNPAGPRYHSDYSTKGFVTAGLSNVPRMAVPNYKKDYEVRNRYSPYGGAIVVKGAFYIHAGPESVDDFGWGSAGCVEIIGSFDDFKKDILTLAGSPSANGDAKALHDGIGSLVSARKLFVTYENAARPNLKAMMSRQVGDDEMAFNDTNNDSPADPTDPGTALAH